MLRMPEGALQGAVAKHRTPKGAAAELGISVRSLKTLLGQAGIRRAFYDRGKNGIAERRVCQMLRKRGMGAVRANYPDPYDILSSGKRIEVKRAAFDTINRCWNINLHRHNKLDESQVDFYVFLLESCPLAHDDLVLVIPAPLRKRTIAIHIHGLLGQWARYFKAFDQLRN